MLISSTTHVLSKCQSSLQVHKHKERQDVAYLTYLKSLGVPNHIAGQSNAAIIKNQVQNPTLGIIFSRRSCIICDERSRYTVPAPKSVNWMHPDTNILNIGMKKIRRYNYRQV